MPKVGMKKFPYTPEGKKDAKAEKMMEMKKGMKKKTVKKAAKKKMVK